MNDHRDVPSSASDDSAHHSLEARLEVALNRLRQQEEFFEMAVHDLRAPLAAMVVYAELLMNRVLGDLHDRQIDHIRTIHRNCTQLIHMAEDVLESTRVRAGRLSLHPARMDLRACVLEAARSLAGLAEAKSIDLDLEPGEPVWIEGDAPRLERAFANVLGNAIKFSPHDGRVCIECSLVDDEARVAITDTGPGIEPERRTSIFRRFETGEADSDTGHGLGLAIASYFIGLHGGRILVEGARHRGSTFLIGLPGRNPSTV